MGSYKVSSNSYLLHSKTCLLILCCCNVVIPKQVITMMSSQNGRHGKKVTSELFFCTHTTANTRKQSANNICFYVASSTFSACPQISSQSIFFSEQSAEISSFSIEENPFQINRESTRCAFLSLNCSGTDVASFNFFTSSAVSADLMFHIWHYVQTSELQFFF